MAKVLRKFLVGMNQCGAHGPLAVEWRLCLRNRMQRGRRFDGPTTAAQQLKPVFDEYVQLRDGAGCGELVVSHPLRRITNHHVANPPLAGPNDVGYQRKRRRPAGKRRLFIDQLIAEPIYHREHAAEGPAAKHFEVGTGDRHGRDGSFTAVSEQQDLAAGHDQAAADVATVFDIQPHGPDVWVGESPDYPWGRIFGGLVIAQALWTATQTVADEHALHSMHAYFILGGDPTEPVRYEVDRIRNGRSFTTRRVVARQSSGAIFNLSCSFQRREAGVETQTASFPADAPDPTTIDFYREGSGVDRFDVSLDGDQPRSLVWARYPGVLSGDPRVHLCALAYLSDVNAMDAVAHAHPSGYPESHEAWDETYMCASLDHAMWFHRPVNANEWLLFDMDGHGIRRTRGLSTGHVFAANGDHIATIAQEGLIRELG